MIVACVLFAVTGAFAKLLSEQMSSIEVVFFRNFIGLLFVSYSLLKTKPIHYGGKFWLLSFRGIMGVLALLAFFYNIAHISLGAAFTFSKTSPIFTALIAAFFLKEKLSLFGWIAIFLGFVGIILIIQPELGLNKNDYIGIFSGVGAALAYTSIRGLRKFYDTRVIVLSLVFYGSLIPLLCMIVAEFYMLPELDFMLSKFVIPDLKGVVYILLMGAFGFYFQIFMTKSYAATKKAGIVAAVSYADVIFSTIIGICLGDAVPNLVAFCGVLLVIVGGVLVAIKK